MRPIRPMYSKVNVQLCNSNLLQTSCNEWLSSTECKIKNGPSFPARGGRSDYPDSEVEFRHSVSRKQTHERDSIGPYASIDKYIDIQTHSHFWSVTLTNAIQVQPCVLYTAHEAKQCLYSEQVQNLKSFCWDQLFYFVQNWLQTPSNLKYHPKASNKTHGEFSNLTRSLSIFMRFVT